MEKPHIHVPVTSPKETVNNGATSGQRKRSKTELKWPPVNLDGSIPADEGVEYMPMTKLPVPRFWQAKEGTDLNTIGTKVNGQETLFLMIASYRYDIYIIGYLQTYYLHLCYLYIYYVHKYYLEIFNVERP